MKRINISSLHQRRKKNKREEKSGPPDNQTSNMEQENSTLTIESESVTEKSQEVETLIEEDIKPLSMTQSMVSVGKQNYINFLSAAIEQQEMMKNVNHSKTGVEFLGDYFTTSATLIWPGNDNTLTVSIYNIAHNKYMIQFFVQDGSKESETLLTLKLYKNNLTVEEVRIISPWTRDAIKDLIHLFNFALRSQIDYSKATMALKDNLNIKEPLNWLEKEEEYKLLCDRFTSRFAIIPQVMLYNTLPVNHINTLWIPAPSTINNPNDVSLKLCFSYVQLPEDVTSLKKDQYHSWLFAQPGFLKLHHYETMERFLRIQVYEEPGSKKSIINPNTILDFWCSLDLEFGELRDLKKGANLSGKDIMKIFDYLNQLFAIQTTYLTDASRANDKSERSEGQIVFRILMGIAYGKTWYESLGYQPFSFENLPRGWADEKDEPLYLSQNAENFIAARNALREMSLVDLYQYFLKEESIHEGPIAKRSETLWSLCNKYFGIDLNQEDAKVPTLSEFTQIIYDSYKKDSAKLEKDLQQLYSLLILPDYYLTPPKNEPIKDQPFHELLSHLVFTKFFHKKTDRNSEESKPNPNSTLNKSNNFDKKS